MISKSSEIESGGRNLGTKYVAKDSLMKTKPESRREEKYIQNIAILDRYIKNQGTISKFIKRLKTDNLKVS